MGAVSSLSEDIKLGFRTGGSYGSEISLSFSHTSSLRRSCERGARREWKDEHGRVLRVCVISIDRANEGVCV